MKQGLEKKKLKEDLSKKILSNFKKNKFNFTDLDLLIDTNLLTERSGEQFKKFTLTYKDLFGKEISLRPDLTVSTALKYIQEKKNKEEKYCYYGSAYRLDKEGDLKVFDQIGCEIINSNNNKSENILINSILEPLKKINNLQVILGDVGLFKILIDSLELPARWKLRLVKNFSRIEYFEDMLKRLETNYDLDQKAIKLDTKRIEDLEKLDPNSIIGGRTVSEIVKRFNKKIKDPRDDYKGKKNVKIIRDFLNINTSIQKVESVILSFFSKNKSQAPLNFFQISSLNLFTLLSNSLTDSNSSSTSTTKMVSSCPLCGIPPTQHTRSLNPKISRVNPRRMAARN